MRIRKHLLAAMAATVLTAALGSPAYADEWDHLAIMDKISEAKAELKKARAAGFEWRDSGKMLKKAEKASKAGDYAKAEKLIAKARKQAKMAMMQAKAQMHAGPHH